MIRFKFNGDLTRAPAAERPGMSDLVQKVAGLTGADIRRVPETDPEDWAEAACQLVTVLESGAETQILWGGRNGSSLMVSGQSCADAIMGALSVQDELNTADVAWPRSADALAKRYPEMIAFQKRAGRETLVCDMPGDPSPRSRQKTLAGTKASMSLEAALEKFEGRTVAVKQTIPLKSMSIRFVDVKPGQVAKAADQVFEEDPYHVMHYEGDKDVLLVQDMIPMTHETRYFVVDGVLVSGAGCVEAHTPLDRDPKNVFGVTHAIFEITRNDGQPVYNRRMAEKLEAFATEAAQEIYEESPDMRFFVLDVAHSKDGPVIVELNPYQNSGLYANDPDAIFAPVVATITETEPAPGPEL